jgi:hypothetical protein
MGGRHFQSLGDQSRHATRQRRCRRRQSGHDHRPINFSDSDGRERCERLRFAASGCGLKTLRLAIFSLAVDHCARLLAELREGVVRGSVHSSRM